MKQQGGFTLIEVLIALLVLSVLGIMLATAMNHVATWQQQLLMNMQQHAQVLRAESLLMTDLLQLAPRVGHDTQGKPIAACYMIDTQTLSCTRFDNRVGGQGVIRIGYQVDTQGLWRLRWSVLDNIENTTPIRQHLLTQVSRMQVQWSDALGKVYTQWPPPHRQPQTLPAMIALTFWQQENIILQLTLPTSDPWL